MLQQPLLGAYCNNHNLAASTTLILIQQPQQCQAQTYNLPPLPDDTAAVSLTHIQGEPGRKGQLHSAILPTRAGLV